MSYPSIVRRVIQSLAVAALLGFGLAMAQTEPTVDQVYQAAQAGRLDQAQTMMQQVLVAHPNSAKAHFVQAELAARMGQAARAREALATAEKLAPGLPFAKPAAVQALRAQLSAPAGSRAAPAAANQMAANSAPAAAAPFPWSTVLLVGAGVLAVGFFMASRRRPAPAGDYSMHPAVQGGLNGPQTFGSSVGAGVPAQGAAYGTPYGVGQPAAPGMGSRIAGGLATGLAVGAGMMAANAIGKTLMGDGTAHPQNHLDGAQAGNFDALPGNADMGGQDFGLNDTASWDDGGGFGGADSGGEW